MILSRNKKNYRHLIAAKSSFFNGIIYIFYQMIFVHKLQTD